MLHPDDIWKLASLIVFVCAGLAAHNGLLPAPLVAAKPWIETVSLVGGLVQAWRMQPGETPSERRRKSRKFTTGR